MKEPPVLLIVDDTPANLNLLESILDPEQYEVRALPSGALALRSAFADPPDLILLDIRMPKMDGYEVCARLKADPRTQDIPVIFISALRETEDKIRAFSAGGVDYITKPFHSEEVLARVNTHLRLRALQQRLAAEKQRAEAANRAKSTFLANMSHELRTPLNAVIGFAQVLEVDDALNRQQRENVGHILRGGNFLLSLVNDVLDLAKIEAGRFEPVIEEWVPRDLLEELAGLFRLRAEQKGLYLRFQPDAGLPARLRSDFRHLRQIVMNLLGNALKFTPRGGVTLRAGLADQRVWVEVADTGPGIDPALRQRIFEPFQQGEAALGEAAGCGLGLSISAGLAHQLQGELTLLDAPSQGSTFRIKVPVEVLEPPLAMAMESDHPTIVGYRRLDGDTRPLRILVVDDVASNLIMLQRLFTALGFVVLVAENGRECLEVARDTRPDALLLDIYLPDLDGLEAVRALRALPEFARVPMLSLSANIFNDLARQSREAGCDAHLIKPVYLPELAATLARFLPVEWCYEPSNRTPSPEPGGLSLEQNQNFVKVLEEGNIAKVIEMADALVESECCPRFASKLQSHAHGFHLAKLKKLLEQAR